MAMQQLPLGVHLRERATFDAFVVGDNREVVARVRDAACARQRLIGWLWGSEGSGRTHLLQAACSAAPLGARVAYLPLAELGATAIDFLGGALEVDLLCLDDLDSVVGDPTIEKALFVAYRRLDERGASLIATAHRSPAALAWSLADIASRFMAS